MTDDQYLKILNEGGEVEVPYFNGQTVGVEACDGVSAEDVLPAFKNFLTLPNSQRLADRRHLNAYFEHTLMAVGEEDVLDDMGGVRPAAEDIWDVVTVKHIFFSNLEAGKYATQLTMYVQIEADAAWEPEHGLQMSWADGKQLVKAGAFDGHPTNGHASADPEKDKFVFVCYDPELCTLPDPE